MPISPLAGKPAPKELLIDPSPLEREYYERRPDLEDRNQLVSFGTSGHRGSPLQGTFTEAHILAITQAICDYRRSQGYDGPLYMDRDIHGQPTANYLWNVKGVVPFLKVDKGPEADKDGVQLMKPIPALAALLEKAKSKRIFGTKMRSFIKQANPAGIKNVVDQQFELAAQIIAAGLIPIVEPEIDIHCPEKAKAEGLLKAAILEKLNQLQQRQIVMWTAFDLIWPRFLGVVSLDN